MMKTTNSTSGIIGNKISACDAMLEDTHTVLYIPMIKKL